MTTDLTHLKFLSLNRRGQHSGVILPIGEWLTAQGPLILCANGYHVTTPEHAVDWIDEACHPVEIRGEVLAGGDKLCCHSIFIRPALPTWTPRTQRLFAADCAERVAYLNPDPRVTAAIDTARRYARGEATDEELAAAGRAAGRAAGQEARGAAEAEAAEAAGRAAREAAGRAARGAAEASRAAESWAAWRAAEGAESWAAWRAAWRAAEGEAERSWQSNRLMKYLKGDLS